MDQSNVMPPRPEAPEPRAPFDPGRFSVDQITLSDLEERSGLDFSTSSRISMFWRRSRYPGPSWRVPTASPVATSAGAFTFAKKEAARLSVNNFDFVSRAAIAVLGVCDESSLSQSISL